VSPFQVPGNSGGPWPDRRFAVGAVLRGDARDLGGENDRAAESMVLHDGGGTEELAFGGAAVNVKADGLVRLPWATARWRG